MSGADSQKELLQRQLEQVRNQESTLEALLEETRKSRAALEQALGQATDNEPTIEALKKVALLQSCKVFGYKVVINGEGLKDVDLMDILINISLKDEKGNNISLNNENTRKEADTLILDLKGCEPGKYVLETDDETYVAGKVNFTLSSNEIPPPLPPSDEVELTGDDAQLVDEESTPGSAPQSVETEAKMEVSPETMALLKDIASELGIEMIEPDPEKSSKDYVSFAGLKDGKEDSDPKKAIEHLICAIQLDQKNKNTYGLIAGALFELSKYNLAERVAKLILELDPKDLAAKIILEKIIKKREEASVHDTLEMPVIKFLEEKAKSLVKEILDTLKISEEDMNSVIDELNIETVEEYTRKGSISSDFKTSVICLVSSILLDSNYGPAYRYLGYELEKNGEEYKGMAYQVYSLGYEVEPSESLKEALERLSEYAPDDELETARTRVMPAMQMPTETPESEEKQVSVLSHQNLSEYLDMIKSGEKEELKQATIDLSAIIRDSKMAGNDNMEAMFLLLAAYDRLKDETSLKEVSRRIIRCAQEHPNDMMAQYYLAKAYGAEGDKEKEGSTLKSLIKTHLKEESLNGYLASAKAISALFKREDLKAFILAIGLMRLEEKNDSVSKREFDVIQDELRGIEKSQNPVVKQVFATLNNGGNTHALKAIMLNGGKEGVEKNIIETLTSRA